MEENQPADEQVTSSQASDISQWLTKNLTPIRTAEKILFVHNLHAMVKAGLSLVDALKILGEQTENKKLRQIIWSVKTGVEKGHELSEVLKEYPKVFPAIFVNMIGAGEAAGKMEEALLNVHTQMKKDHELISRVRGAMIYPLVIIIAMIGIGIQMVFFVLPKIIVMFEEFSAELPLATRILIAVVTFFQRYGIYLSIFLLALAALSVYTLRHKSVRPHVHAFNLRLPIFGKIIKKINIARFTLTLSTLLESTIPIVEAVKICANVQTNLIFRQNLLAAAELLKKGDSLSDILKNYRKSFPPMVVQMIMVGEQSGQLEKMLFELSDYYGAEVDNTMKNFSTIIEPVIIVVLGLAVAGIAVAVIMPMYSLAQNF